MFLPDICDLDFISKVFEKERPTHVCHLAGESVLYLTDRPFRPVLILFLSFIARAGGIIED